MGGGKDTTGTTLSWFILMLCRYPVIQEKLAEEIKEATNMKGGCRTISDFAANLKEEALDKMNYLHAVLSETIRLYPAIPVVNIYINLFHILTMRNVQKRLYHVRSKFLYNASFSI